MSKLNSALGFMQYILNGVTGKINRALDPIRSRVGGFVQIATSTTGTSVYDTPNSKTFHLTNLLITNETAATACRVLLYDSSAAAPAAGETRCVITLAGEETAFLSSDKFGDICAPFTTDCRAQLSVATTTVDITVAGILRTT